MLKEIIKQIRELDKRKLISISDKAKIAAKEKFNQKFFVERLLKKLDEIN